MIGIGVSPSLLQYAGTSLDPSTWTPSQYREIVKLLVFNRARRAIGLHWALNWQYPRT